MCATTFLADRASGPVPVFLQRSPHFRVPEDGDRPMIMVGPGTGIAPFRGFLQERRALGHAGRNWLFFGDQHRSDNFYYRDELEVDGHATASSTGWTWRSPAIRPIASTSSTRCSTTAPTCGAGSTRARTSTCAVTRPAWPRDVDAALTPSSRPTAGCPRRPLTITSASWWPRSATSETSTKLCVRGGLNPHSV